MWPTFQHIWKAQFVEDFFVKQSFFTRPLRETAWLGLIGDGIWLVFTLAGLIGLVGPLREGLHRRLFSLAWLGYSLLTVLDLQLARILCPASALMQQAERFSPAPRTHRGGRGSASSRRAASLR